MRARILVFTPVNPTRPFYERLNRVHDRNVAQNSCRYKYVKRQCLLSYKEQQSAQLRGVNVCRVFNEIYNKYRDYEFLCKWDDDIVLPPNTLNACLQIFDDDPEVIGVGLFQEEYGAPNILMCDQLADGFYGAFSRFYMYRTRVWGNITIDVLRGDPDNAFQIALPGKKVILELPSLHLHHRVFSDKQYKVFIDLADYITR